MLKKRYLIYAPPFTFNEGGVIWLYKLVKNLNKLGENASIYFWHWDTRSPWNKLSYKTLSVFYERMLNRLHCFSLNNYIVIYPEIVDGNPLNSNNVVRWLLNIPEVFSKGKADSYDKSNLIFSTAAYITNQTKERFGFLNIQTDILTAYEHNLDIFQNKGLPKHGSCYAKRKGKNKTTVDYIPKDSLEISWGKSAEELARIFNEKEVFYSYDHLTYLSVQAALCGCLSIVIPDEVLSAKEWYQQVPHFRYGVAYGLEEIPHAKKTAHLVRQNLINLETESLKQTKKFIETTQNYF